MKHRIRLGDRFVFYELTRKKVKNINIRIKPGGEILVSCGKNVPISAVDDLLRQKEAWIFRALDALSAEKPVLPEDHAYLCGKIVKLPADQSKEQWLKEKAQELLPAVYEQVWTLFEQDGFPKPALRLRKMKSRWGSCIPVKGVITLNTALVGADEDCQRSVAAHELCHMLHPDHSAAFYQTLEQRFPAYRACRERLKSAQGFLLDL